MTTTPKSEPLPQNPWEITDGDLVSLVKRLVNFTGKWSSIACGFYSRQDYAPESQTVEHRRRQMRRVDIILAFWWVIPFLSYALILRHPPTIITWVVLLLLALRVINIAFYNLRVALVETNYIPRQPPIHLIVSAKRSLTLGIVNFVELIMCFGCMYAAFADHISVTAPQVKDAFVFCYFSCITQLTIGYGDVQPLGGLRLVTCAQGLIGLLLITMTIGRMISLVRFEEARDEFMHHKISETGQHLTKA